MKNQPSTLASNVSVQQRNTNSVQSESHTRTTAPRTHFTRSALFTALATSLVGFGIAPAALADTTNSGNTPDQSMTNQVAPNQIVANPSTSLMDDDTQLDRALDALHLKKAVEQGIIEQSVLDDYSEQSLGIKKSDTPSQNLAPSQANAKDEFDTSEDINSPNSAQLNFPSSINEDLSQQAAAVQQQGYQMMTPEQIDRELAAMDLQNAQDINNIGNVPNDSDFDTPIATLNDATPPIGLDVELDATNLPAPSNLDTLGRNETDAETAEIMSRPINVSDAVSSGRVDDAGDNSGEMVANASTEDDTPSDVINPDDYLPDYQTETQAVNQSLEQASKPKPLARNSSNIVKRLYNRLFNGGAMALPHVETTVYLQQEASAGTVSGQPNLIKADNDVQPMKNIKAALDDTTVQSVVDFTAALPRLRETALDAAKAVGYYDVTLRLRQPNRDTIDVIIEELGEPVRVDSRIVDIRGEGSEQEEFVTLEETLPPQEGDIFNHRVYKNSKAALESLSNTYGYFDEYWLNKSVDIILPDNTADVSLVYNTGDRYEFDEVVFFTYDEETNTLTQDPDKLPVELSLLQQLFDFEPGDPFYRPAVTKFSNDLSATRYFNTVNVESILPPDERSEASTLDFDNAPAMSNNELDDDINNAGVTDTTGSNEDESLAAINDRRNSRQDSKSGSMSNTNNDEVVAEGESSLDTNNTETVNAADIAAIEFEADEETLDKLQAIRQKAERLSNLPNDRVLDEKDQEADNLLGKISDSISNIAQKIFPDEESILADENFVPPTLAGRKTPQEVAESKKVPLYVFVSSSKPRDAQVGLGYGTDTGVRATAKIDYNLLNRQGYQAGAETEVSRITKNVTVYASRPWKHPLNDTLEGRLTYEEEVIDQGEGNFDLSTSTLKAALARNIRRESGWNRSYSVRYRLDELETGVDETELDDLPIRFTSSKPKQQALLFGYGINKTDVDSATNPTRGIRQYYAIEAGADKALSDTDLAIVRAGVSGIYSFGEDKKHQVLGSVNAGYIWADDFYDVPYKLRFFAGGDQSIRGYDYESLSPLDKGYLTGGQILAVGSAEYNYEFRPGFRGAFFTDVGNAYDKDFETETKVGVGVGIRWASPVGVVRVDVAAGVTEESIPVRLHFFIGSPL
jgi:translocation and assembly module TamA